MSDNSTYYSFVEGVKKVRGNLGNLTSKGSGGGFVNMNSPAASSGKASGALARPVILSMKLSSVRRGLNISPLGMDGEAEFLSSGSMRVVSISRNSARNSSGAISVTVEQI